ncbi:MAG TPA: hypothetical protein VFJ90_00285 [Candidatus Didemnitutus sp.]|nr:hypothetical protein [Candidatus Didemnitutus sp.]
MSIDLPRIARAVAAAFACFIVAGCTSWLPDERVVGVFRADNGNAIEIRSNGRIYFEDDTKKEFMGMVTVTRDTPITIFITTPDPSPFAGTVIKFSADRTNIEVEWSDWRRTLRGEGPPTRFQKDRSLQSPSESAPDRHRA